MYNIYIYMVTKKIKFEIRQQITFPCEMNKYRGNYIVLVIQQSYWTLNKREKTLFYMQTTPRDIFLKVFQRYLFYKVIQSFFFK